MSGIVNKIKDAVTGHHTTNTTTHNTTGMTGSHTAVGAAPLGSAQVRDTSLTGTHGSMSSTTSGAMTGAAAGHATGHTASGAMLGAAAGHHMAKDSHLHGSTMSNMSTNTAGALSHDNAMTRSEEHLLVGKEQVNLGKAGLHKYVTTEHVATTVPVVKERAVVEREPITAANRAAAVSGPDFKEAHHEVNLMAERVVTQKEEVPIERVRLRKEQEVTNQYVEADLRKEHIEVADGTKTLGSGLETGSSRLATDVNSQSRRM